MKYRDPETGRYEHKAVPAPPTPYFSESEQLDKASAEAFSHTMGGDLTRAERRLHFGIILASVLVIFLCVFIIITCYRLGRQSEQPRIDSLTQATTQSQRKAEQASADLATCQINLTKEEVEERSMHGKVEKLEDAFEKDQKWHVKDKAFWKKYERRIVIVGPSQ